jgi:hypothetical protein
MTGRGDLVGDLLELVTPRKPSCQVHLLAHRRAL